MTQKSANKLKEEIVEALTGLFISNNKNYSRDEVAGRYRHALSSSRGRKEIYQSLKYRKKKLNDPAKVLIINNIEFLMKILYKDCR